MPSNGVGASIILENGEKFTGSIFGYKRDCVVGEVVFATSMIGYQEIITDPSYTGQIVVLTFPEIGDYGIDLKVSESKNPQLKGLIIHRKCDVPHNFKSEMTLSAFLKENRILGVEGVDTRLLTRTIRKFGSIKCMITTDLNLLNHSKDFFGNCDTSYTVKNVSTKKIYAIKNTNAISFKKFLKTKVLLIDMGCKNSIIKELLYRNCDVIIAPFDITVEQILIENPDMILISNGPGNPEDNQITICNVRQLLGKIPICGICMGHQIIGLALDAKIMKLKYGHHGTNHPVKDLQNNKIFTTSQNHNYCLIDLPKDIIAAFKSINDDTIEGIFSKKYKIFSVQFHPEACPGPKDCNYIFDKFLEIR